MRSLGEVGANDSDPAVVGAPATDRPVVVIGAGMAGLSAAYRLSQLGEREIVVVEKDRRVGGASRTVAFGDFRFDLGGHRFYTKKAAVQRFVKEVVGDDLVTVGRRSRIFFNGRFVDYPLKPMNAMLSLGAFGSIHAVADYVWEKLTRLWRRDVPEDSFEQWALPRFGRYLYEAYFKIYTEKIWGLPCTEISADFAKQRIKNLSFREAIREALLGKSESTSLIREFLYPRRGFGQITDNMASRLNENGSVLTGAEVVELAHDGRRIKEVTVRGEDGSRESLPCSDVISSIALTELLRALRPQASDALLAAADRLLYRDMVVLFLVLERAQVSPDHWLYVPSPEIGFARVHEPKNWSAEMAPAAKTGLALEYFCRQGDHRWRQPPEQMAAEAARELEQLGLIRREEVTGFTSVHLAKAYPVYNVGYRADLDMLLDYLSGFENLQTIGRNGRFVYTSSDHYIDMGIKAAENLGRGADHELGRIGREEGYAELISEDGAD